MKICLRIQAFWSTFPCMTTVGYVWSSCMDTSIRLYSYWLIDCTHTYTYIHTYTYTYIYTHIHTCIYTYTHIHHTHVGEREDLWSAWKSFNTPPRAQPFEDIKVCIYWHMHMYIYVCMYMYVYTYKDVYVYVCICVFLNVHSIIYKTHKWTHRSIWERK